MQSELEPDITVTLTNDDYWRIRSALAESATMHQKAADRCSGTNQRSTDVILHHEHIIRRMIDVELLLKTAADKAYVTDPPRSVELTDSEDAVLIDSLAYMREVLREKGQDTPNVESALAKIISLMSPSTIGLRIVEVQA